MISGKINIYTELLGIVEIFVGMIDMRFFFLSFFNREFQHGGPEMAQTFYSTASLLFS